MSTREAIARGFEIWARRGVERDFCDRLETPESPISERLFRLVWDELGKEKAG